jgi:hypothetical protein
LEQVVHTAVEKFIRKEITKFHNKKIKKIRNLSTRELINGDPFLVAMNNVNTGLCWIRQCVDRIVFASEETLRGHVYENIAKFILKLRFKEITLDSPVDIVLEGKHNIFLIEIKSGSSWGNSSQWFALRKHFEAAEKQINLMKINKSVIKLLGICYGNSRHIERDDGIIELRGPAFWTFVSGSTNFYFTLGKLCNSNSKLYAKKVELEKHKTILRLMEQFKGNVCYNNGEINKKKLLELNGDY